MSQSGTTITSPVSGHPLHTTDGGESDLRATSGSSTTEPGKTKVGITSRQ
jgi:hypothetical protein